MPSFLANPLVCFSLMIFASATLLFFVEFMVGKMVLPKFGGTPAVWATCMLFYQAVLLLGYSYAFAVSAWSNLRKQIYFHCGFILLPLIAFVLFPLHSYYRHVEPVGDAFPAVYVLLIMAQMIGLPFLVVSTSAPLMQRWFSYTGHSQAKDPYFLYAASNAGSMLALILYPFFVELIFSLNIQGVFWMIGYALLVALTIGCGYLVLQGPAAKAQLQLAAAGAAPPVPSEQITEKPPAAPPVSEQPPPDAPPGETTNGPSAEDAGDKPDPTQETANGSEEAAADKPAPEEQIADKPTAVALKGAKRWRKSKSKPDSSEAITRTPAAKKAIAKTAPVAEVAALAGRPSLGTVLRWIALAFVPSSLFIGLTTYMTTDIAAIPLLWMPPLAIYILSFILVFSRLPNWVHQASVLSLPVAVLLLTFLVLKEYFVDRHPDPDRTGFSIWIVYLFLLHLVTLFVVAMACHGELARSRPTTKYLTAFFLIMSFGGVLGGLFNSFVAPFVFNSISEYYLVIVAACLLLPPIIVDSKNKWNRYIDNGLAGGLTLAAGYVVWKWVPYFNNLYEQDPNKLDPWLVIPGPKPGLNAVLLWSGLLAVLLLYIGVPPIRRLGQRIGNLGDSWWSRPLKGYLLQRESTWFSRVLDVALPVALFLLTFELIMNSPFNNWPFTWLRDTVKISHWRIVVVFTCGLPVALCYGFAEQPIRFGLGVAAILLSGAWQSDQSSVLYQERTFFGVLKVEDTGAYHRLLHGTTLHGMQRVGSDEPLTYYHRTGPVGQAYQTWIQGQHAKANVAFIGLGTGTMASYINPGQTATFYEIDRSVIEISQDMGYFTYLKTAKERGGEYVFDVGDARLKMKHAPNGTYRLIVVDAFSSDAIPIHLITKEAVQMYFEKLTVDGVACIHISNRYLDLGPVLGNIAKELGLSAVQQYDHETDINIFPGKNSSDWVMLARKPEYLDRLKWFNSFNSIQGLLDYHKELEERGYRERAKKVREFQDAVKLNVLASMLGANHAQVLADAPRWNDLGPEPSQTTWTDDFSNILSIFRWR